MRTIALINQKGGCGKTTCSINLAACLAQLNQRTLLLDMDPQGHCAVGLAVPDAQIERSMYDLLASPDSPQTIKDITWQIAGHFDLAPSNISLVALETELHGIEGRQDRLANQLHKVQAEYDYCIIDCPPNVGLLTFNAMRACTEVLIPVETGYFSLHGLAKQLELIESLRKQCKQEIRVRILATLYDIRTKLAREVLAELREQFGDLVMESAINFNTKLKEAASFGQPITEYDPASKGFKDFLKLARELMGPAARITLDLSSYLPETSENAAHAAAAVGQTPNNIPLGIELPAEDPNGAEIQKLVAATATLAPVAPAPVSAQGYPQETTIMRAARDLRAQADALAKRAAEIQSTAQGDLGLTPATARKSHSTQRKIDDFYGPRQVKGGVMFSVHIPNAKSVAVAGDFNQWQADKNLLKSNGDPSSFRAVVPLAAGRYRYRLVVDGNWQSDPHNAVSEPNPFGGLNSVLEVQ